MKVSTPLLGVSAENGLASTMSEANAGTVEEDEAGKDVVGEWKDSSEAGRRRGSGRIGAGAGMGIPWVGPATIAG